MKETDSTNEGKLKTMNEQQESQLVQFQDQIDELIAELEKKTDENDNLERKMQQSLKEQKIIEEKNL